MKNIFQTRQKKRKFFNNNNKKDEDDSKISSKSLIITHNNAMIIATYILYVCINLNIINYAKSTHNNNTRIFYFYKEGWIFKEKRKFLFFDP